MKCHKVLLLGSYHGNNKGDEIILYSFLNRIKTINHAVEIWAATLNPAYLSQKYGIIGFMPISPFAVLKAIRKCDLIILGGGPLFDYNLIDTLRINKKSQILYWLLVSLLGKILGKSVLWVAIGAGPINTKLSKSLINFIGKKIDVIAVRDMHSKNVLNSLIKGRDNILESKDIVYGCDFNKIKVDNRYSHDKYFLIIPRSWNKIKDMKTRECYKKVIIEIRKRGFQVIIYPTNLRQDGKLCNDLLTEVLAHGRDNGGIRLINYYCEGIDLFINLMKYSFAVITMRMHAALLSSLFSIPSIAFVYKTMPKLTSQMADIGLKDFCFDLDNFSLDFFIDKIDYLIRNREKLAPAIRTEISRIQREEVLNATILERYLG